MATPARANEQGDIEEMADWTLSVMPDLAGRVFVVTGGNSGVGYETSVGLASKGATVVMACRNRQRGEQALMSIREEFPSASVELIDLDLSNLGSVRRFAERFKGARDRLDGLINNAGPIGAERIETQDGFESHFGAGHLGHYALTGLLMDVLCKTPASRVVTVGSRMHVSGQINWNDLNGESKYNRWAAYRQGKLANMLFALEFDRRLRAHNSTTMSVAAHPGLVKSNWVENNLSGPMKALGKLMMFSYQDPAMAALSVLYAATDDDVEPGGYYGPEHDKKGYPAPAVPGDAALDESAAARLWDVSEDLTGITYEFDC